MVKRHDKGSDGKYHINGKIYPMLEGSRAQVMHGTAYKTPGGLTKGQLKMTRGRIVSVKKSNLAKSQRHLKGHLQPKGSGKFGNTSGKKSRRRRRSKKAKR
ncbi:hypothetical protein N8996_01675 [Candidatus Poseidonia alphae]|nr:hypothetical protein [Candidatus Poseidonia alphae]